MAEEEEIAGKEVLLRDALAPGIEVETEIGTETEMGRLFAGIDQEKGEGAIPETPPTDPITRLGTIRLGLETIRPETLDHRETSAILEETLDRRRSETTHPQALDHRETSALLLEETLDRPGNFCIIHLVPSPLEETTWQLGRHGIIHPGA